MGAFPLPSPCLPSLHSCCHQAPLRSTHSHPSTQHTNPHLHNGLHHRRIHRRVHHQQGQRGRLRLVQGGQQGRRQEQRQLDRRPPLGWRQRCRRQDGREQGWRQGRGQQDLGSALSTPSVASVVLAQSAHRLIPPPLPSFEYPPPFPRPLSRAPCGSSAEQCSTSSFV